MRVVLTDRERKSLEILARGRHFLKDIVTPNRGLERWNNSQYQADLLGVMGEYAVSKVLKIPFDTEVNLAGDGGKTDLWLGDWSIQVKTTKYTSGRLVFNSLDEMKSLINVLVICDPASNEVKIAGYISNRNLIKGVYKEDLGYGVRYCLDQGMLRDIAWLPFYFLEYRTGKYGSSVPK